jgi:NAD(P)-dependent dehydrogenase (short-subunit alcohol dehydrogenase family)
MARCGGHVLVDYGHSSRQATGLDRSAPTPSAMPMFADAPASSGADVGNLLDVQLIEASDVSNAVAWLVSDQARYVTGVALPVDAGYTAK